MPEELNHDTNFKIIDKRSPDTQARKAEMPDHIRDVKEMILKPCPFCGGRAFVNSWEHSERTHYTFAAHVLCQDCQGSSSCGGFHNSASEAEKEAILRWNCRTT